MIPELQIHPAPGGAALNDTFSVEVRLPGGEWRGVDVHDVRVDLHTLSHASFASFDFRGAVEVRFRQNKVVAQQIEVRPGSAGIEPAYQETPLGNGYVFTLDRPRNLSIEVNGDRFHNLHLFANPIDQAPPNPSAPDVIYFGPGLHTFGSHPAITSAGDIGGKPKSVVTVASGQTVYLAGGSVVQAAIISEPGARGIAIRGRGVLDLSPWNESKGYFAKGSTWQGPAICLDRANGVFIEGVTIKQPTGYAVLGGDVSDVTIDNIKAFSSHVWADGIDIMAGNHVEIRNVFMRTSDDCVAIYGSRWAYRGGSSDWRVIDSVLWADKAHPIFVGVHGDYEGDGDTIENLHFQNIDILENDEILKDFWGALAINCGDKNTVRNVCFQDIRVDHIREAGGHLIDLAFRYFPPSAIKGRRIENIEFRNITCAGLAGSYISGEEDSPIDGVTIENLVINGKRIENAAQAGFTIGRNVSGLTFV